MDLLSNKNHFKLQHRRNCHVTSVSICKRVKIEERGTGKNAHSCVTHVYKYRYIVAALLYFLRVLICRRKNYYIETSSGVTKTMFVN